MQLPIDAYDLTREEVEARFKWAMRQGHQWWLWPDLAQTDWRDALVLIETITRQVLTQGHADEPLRGLRDAIGIAAFTSGMGPLLGYWSRSGALHGDADVLAGMELQYHHNSQRMKTLTKWALSAVHAIADLGVEVVVLKGIHNAYAYFPDPGARPQSDIDLLVRPGELSKVAATLRSLGYRRGRVLPWEQTWQHGSATTVPKSVSLMHFDNPWSIDLHVTLNRRYSEAGPLIALDDAVGPSQLEDWVLSSQAKALAPAAQVLHLACHASCRFENLMLMRLVELNLVIRKSAQESAPLWAEFLRLGKSSGTLSSAFPALYQAEQLAPGTVPAEVLEACESRAPLAVRRVVRRLRPASAHRVVRCSLEERFMWTTSIGGAARQMFHEIIPWDFPLSLTWASYKNRFWRLLGGRPTRRAPDGF